MVPVAALLFLTSQAFAQVETTDFGGRDQFNVGTNAYKLNVYEVDEARVLTLIEVWLDADPGDEVVFVAYRSDANDPDAFRLVYQSDPAALSGGDGLKRSPELALPLEVGRTYAVGLYLQGDPIRYYWGGAPTDEAPWGTRVGAMYSNSGTTPTVVDPLRDDITPFGYRQRLTVAVASDADADGYDATVDCDDDDADVHPDAEEVCDGQDTDCDGALGPDEDVDGDGDGSPACADCDDADADVYPGAVEDPCGTVDMDCDGSPPDLTECTDPDRADRITGSRQCDTGGSPVGFGLVLALAALRRRAYR